MPTDHSAFAIVRSCDFGGGERQSAFTHETYREPDCLLPPLFRYRGPGTVEGHWNFRCARHAAVLDSTICTIERLEGCDD